MSLKLVVALDFDTQKEADALVEQLNPNHCALKVGSELFTRLGPTFVRQLVDKNFKVFLDLKFHDIPNTVKKACLSVSDLGVWMLNVHASGGLTMMHEARLALDSLGKQRPLLIAVTVLTSMEKADLDQIGIQKTPEDHALYLAQLTNEAGLDGVVCSAYEARAIKKQCQDDGFVTVVPGIRLLGDDPNDQKRIMTPLNAINMGADYLVIGRSITKASNPAAVVTEILASLSHAAK